MDMYRICQKVGDPKDNLYLGIQVDSRGYVIQYSDVVLIKYGAKFFKLPEYSLITPLEYNKGQWN